MNGKKIILMVLICLLIVLSVATGILWHMTHYVLVGFRMYPRDARELDLRAESLSVSDYETMTRKLPDCEIHWSVPFRDTSYPEDVTEVSVKLTVDGELTRTYPKYDNGWQVTALTDSTLIDKDGQTYSYLYWEALTDAEYDFSKGFCIKGEDTAEFLEDALEKLGLNRREANEFIIYWLPRMEQNEYNIISFQTDVYTESAKLEISPVPDTLIRVFMAYMPAENPIEIEAQELDAPERVGFTVVEWGGAEID